MATPLLLLGQFFGWFALSFPLPGALLLAVSRCTRWQWFGPLEAALGKAARHPRRAILLSGGVAFLVSMALSLWVRMPQPHVHDEFSYLLAADTFAHGRLTNPTHPLWPFFESLHTIQHPSYASKYPPGQGLILAAGQVLTGSPAAGLWLSAGLACAGLCWMLQAWLPARWALLGGLLAAIHPTIIKWGQGYWGGDVALIGGALLLGGMRRLCRPGEALRPGDALWTGLGIAVLANSRPYEGLVLTATALTVLVVHLTRQGIGFRPFLTRLVLPLMTVLTLTGAWMGYYNWRVTGGLLRLPYIVHEATYEPVPFLIFEGLRQVPYCRDKSIRDIEVDGALADYTPERSLPGFVEAASQKIGILTRADFQMFDLSVDDYDPPSEGGILVTALRNILLIPLLALPWAIARDPWTKTGLAVAGVFFCALLLETWMHPHYAAPIAGLSAVLLLQGLRRLRAWRRHGRPVGRSLGRIVVGLYLLSFVSTVWQLRQPEWQWPGWPPAKQQVIARLRQSGPLHDLVIVRYKPDHQPSWGEWVYNGAEIDRQPVIWARELTPPENARLLAYYHDRRVWLLQPDEHALPLTPYPVSQTLAVTASAQTSPTAATAKPKTQRF